MLIEENCKKVHIDYKNPLVKNMNEDNLEIHCTEGIQVNHNGTHVYLLRKYSREDCGTLEVYRLKDIVQMYEIERFDNRFKLFN